MDSMSVPSCFRQRPLPHRAPSSPLRVMFRRQCLIIFVTILVALSLPNADALPAGSVSAAPPPNVLVMMVDDLGFSDLGCYGGEIETPNLDRLAGDGLRFSQFYNTAKCHSSRVSLLTGQYCLAAGDTSLAHGVTSAEVLQKSGYTTAMTGKWHLDREPTDFGFQKYFGHLSGACDYFVGDKTFRFNGKPWQVPASGFYTTVANVDYGLKFLDQSRQKDLPWYLYIAFNAPHAPLQALAADYAKYEGRYDAGWDVIRDQRIEKQKRIGLLDRDLVESPRPEHVVAWERLSDARKEFENKRMTTLAAMIDRVDQEVGRLIKNLEQSGELDNTIIWFVSDNGACPYDRTSNRIDAIPTNSSVHWSDSTGWAWARNSPFRYYKQNQFEGGISSPAIVHWPAGLKTSPGSIVHQPAHLIDVMPTLAEVASAPIPNRWPGRNVRAVSGISLVPIFQGGTVRRDDPLHFQFSTDRALRDGDWKAVSFRGEAWELYDLSEDRTELHNLAEEQPERLASLVGQWMKMGQEVLHAPKKLLKEATPARLPHFHPEWTAMNVDPVNGGLGNGKRGRVANPAQPMGIRARKNTKIQIKNDELQLQFTGDDPGIAIDQLGPLSKPGPYLLSMRVRSDSSGPVEVFFATDPVTALPAGTRVVMDVPHDQTWREVSLRLDTDQAICKLRIDVGDGPGEAQIRDLHLSDVDGNILFRPLAPLPK